MSSLDDELAALDAAEINQRAWDEFRARMGLGPHPSGWYWHGDVRPTPDAWVDLAREYVKRRPEGRGALPATIATTPDGREGIAMTGHRDGGEHTTSETWGLNGDMEDPTTQWLVIIGDGSRIAGVDLDRRDFARLAAMRLRAWDEA